MTSKECLKHLIEELALNQANAQIIMGMPSKDEMEINKICYQQVLKDLEVLEIFKKHCDFSLWGDDLNILAKEEYNTEYDSSVYTSVRIPNEEDRKAIKEWIESDN